MDIDCGSKLYNDLVKAQQSLVVANYLHLLYLATPYDMVTDVKPNWMTYLHEASQHCSFCMYNDIEMSSWIILYYGARGSADNADWMNYAVLKKMSQLWQAVVSSGMDRFW